MAQYQHLTGTVNNSKLSRRLDQVLAELFPNHSRSRIKAWILDGKVKINGRVTAVPKAKMLGGEYVEIHAVIDEPCLESQDIALDIVHEDDDIIVINKQRYFVVHPGAGNAYGTVLNALLHYYPPIANLPRAGIVHRLDKDTTGLMVVAKTIPAHILLVESLQARAITREYEAVAIGTILSGGTVEQPITRHVTKRTHMAMHNPIGKPAVTHYRIIENFRVHTRLRLWLETGRTHQIRLHMAHINHPLVGDKLYSVHRPHLPKCTNSEFYDVLRRFDRQALHSTMLRLYHPISLIEMEWHVPMPQDMVELINALKADTEQFIFQ